MAGVQVDQYWGGGQVMRLPGEQAVGQSCGLGGGSLVDKW